MGGAPSWRLCTSWWSYGVGFGDVISAEVLRCYVLEEAVARILTRWDGSHPKPAARPCPWAPWPHAVRSHLAGAEAVGLPTAPLSRRSARQLSWRRVRFVRRWDVLAREDRCVVSRCWRELTRRSRALPNLIPLQAGRARPGGRRPDVARQDRDAPVPARPHDRPVARLPCRDLGPDGRAQRAPPQGELSRSWRNWSSWFISVRRDTRPQIGSACICRRGPRLLDIRIGWWGHERSKPSKP